MEDYKIIIDVLNKILYKNYKSSELLNSIRYNNLNSAYLTQVVYGVLENKIYIDYMIEKLSNVKLNKLEKKIFLTLEIGIYSLFFMNKKDYAVVNNIVNFVKTFNKRSSGFVNAILRNAIRREDEIKKIDKLGLDYLSIKYSHPKWILEYLSRNYDYEFLENYCRLNNENPKFSIRVNRLKIKLDDLKNELQKK